MLKSRRRFEPFVAAPKVGAPRVDLRAQQPFAAVTLNGRRADKPTFPLADECVVRFVVVMNETDSTAKISRTENDPERTLYRLALEALNSLSHDSMRTFTRQFSANADFIPYKAPSPRPDIELPVPYHDAAPQFERLCSAFVDLYDKVAWGEGYNEEDLGKGVKLGGWVPLASSEGPFVAQDALLALTALNARAYYPPHRHWPEEMYVTMSGGFWFERPGKEAVWVGPGDVVFTEQNEIHALRGGGAATLMIACWAGGSYQKSEIVL